MAEPTPHFYQWETKILDIGFVDEETGAELEQPALEGWREIAVSLGQNDREKVVLEARKDGESDEGIEVDEENDTVTVHLGQEDTAKFKVGECDIQVNLYYYSRERDASLDGTLDVRRNMHRKVMG